MKLLNYWPFPEGRENPFTEGPLVVSEVTASSEIDLFELLGLYMRHVEGTTAIMKVITIKDGYELRITAAGDADMTVPEGPMYNAIDFPEAAFFWKVGEVRKFLLTELGLFYELDNPECLLLPGVQIDWEERKVMQSSEIDKV